MLNNRVQLEYRHSFLILILQGLNCGFLNHSEFSLVYWDANVPCLVLKSTSMSGKRARLGKRLRQCCNILAFLVITCCRMRLTFQDASRRPTIAPTLTVAALKCRHWCIFLTGERVDFVSTSSGENRHCGRAFILKSGAFGFKSRLGRFRLQHGPSAGQRVRRF